MGRLDGKVAFISGVARGQGRSHALHLAAEGADIIGFDICAQMDTVEYPMATLADLRQTEAAIAELERRSVLRQADVRDPVAVQAVFDEGLAKFGRVDIVVANAGVAPTWSPSHQPPDGIGKDHRVWHDVTEVLLSGVYFTIDAAAPTLVAQNSGGSVIIISSTAGLKAVPHSWEAASDSSFSYCAAKHGVVGLMRAYARALAPYSIRVNSLHPTGVNTPMVVNDAFQGFAVRHRELGAIMQNALPVAVVEPVDVSNAVLWLSSDEARYVTGVTLPIDAGFNVL
jgi:SDR family mycofactocin-dependent oxidoreductase